tara:strand:+ start:177 stop:674 length:498 start_codon:yes stop_codon:yes gene_type:complete
MILKVPKWSIPIKDEGAFTFAAFADRMCRVHGFDEMYTIHIDDVVRICNKRSFGIIEWLRSIPEISDNIELGHLYEHVVCFKLKEPELIKAAHAGRPRLEYMYPRELKEDRQKFVWMYLLGSLNHNLIKEPELVHERNTFGIKEFFITREAQGYIKKKDRQEIES